MADQITAQNIADYFLGVAYSTESLITNMKLQKLVYYAQAWHMGIFSKPIFQDDFQAWVHGPVIPGLYQIYKGFKWNPILVDWKPDNHASLVSSLGADLQGFLEEISQNYFPLDAYQLERMTHSEDPWRKARGEIAPDVNSSNIIKKEWMQEYYSQYVKS